MGRREGEKKNFSFPSSPPPLPREKTQRGYCRRKEGGKGARRPVTETCISIGEGGEGEPLKTDTDREKRRGRGRKFCFSFAGGRACVVASRSRGGLAIKQNYLYLLRTRARCAATASSGGGGGITHHLEKRTPPPISLPPVHPSLRFLSTPSLSLRHTLPPPSPSPAPNSHQSLFASLLVPSSYVSPGRRGRERRHESLIVQRRIHLLLLEGRKEGGASPIGRAMASKNTCVFKFS